MTGRPREYGSTLVLRDLATRQEARIADVVAYVFDDSAKYLGYTLASRTPGRDGAYARRVAQPAEEIVLASGPGDYRALTFDRAGGETTEAPRP